MDYFEIRESIVKYSQLMYNEHLVSATSGNISIRLPDRADTFAITAVGAWRMLESIGKPYH